MSPLAAARFDGILFDAGGVLVVPDPIALGPVLSGFGGRADVGGLVRAHYAGMRALDLSIAGQDRPIEHLDWTAYRAGYARATGVPGEAVEEAVAAMGPLFSPYLWRFPLLEAVAALHRLRVAGVPIGIVSNASGQIEGILASLGVCQVGDGAGVPVTCVIDSHVVGVAKPDPAIFKFALAALGEPDPSRVAYVGDSAYSDIVGGSAAGLVPLHLDPYDDNVDAPHERIRSLHELLPG